ncbi:hypothetical protein [Burkholderia latens]|uniref:hypothetical protein n=1 Tax=Burkholderia latens TaxID=488446 RepID=UPI00158C3F78|nr:hypothetical protein [Burkholderia latens]
MELNRIKTLLRDLALSHGLTDADLRAYNEEADDLEWYINWKRDQEELFAKEMRRVRDALDLYESAMNQGDKLTAKAGLIHAGIALQGLSGFFDGLMHDVKKAYSDPRFGWPKFPSDDWKIPPEYGFKE